MLHYNPTSEYDFSNTYDSDFMSIHDDVVKFAKVIHEFRRIWNTPIQVLLNNYFSENVHYRYDPRHLEILTERLRRLNENDRAKLDTFCKAMLAKESLTDKENALIGYYYELVLKTPELSQKYFETAARQGYKVAEIHLLWDSFYSLPKAFEDEDNVKEITRKLSDIIEFYEHNPQQDDPVAFTLAMNKLGFINLIKSAQYDFSETCLDFRKAAVDCFTKAGARGSIAGTLNASIHEERATLHTDKLKQKFKAQNIAGVAGRGNVEGLALLGDLYRYGEGVPIDANKAAFCLRLAAENGHKKSRKELEQTHTAVELNFRGWEYIYHFAILVAKEIEKYPEVKILFNRLVIEYPDAFERASILDDINQYRNILTPEVDKIVTERKLVIRKCLNSLFSMNIKVKYILEEENKFKYDNQYGNYPIVDYLSKLLDVLKNCNDDPTQIHKAIKVIDDYKNTKVYYLLKFYSTPPNIPEYLKEIENELINIREQFQAMGIFGINQNPVENSSKANQKNSCEVKP